MNETQKNDSIVDALNRLGETAVSQELAERSDALFEEKLAEQRAPWGKRTRTSRRFIRWLPMGAAAALILAAIVFALLSSGPNNIAWADVMEKFKSVNFVNVICYIRDGATNEPKQVELWMGHGGKVRIHHGTQVIFGERGKLIKCLDVKTRKESEPIEPAVALLEVFGPSGSMSLEAIIKEMGGDPSLSSPIVSQEASVEEHMTVFDINNDRTPEWARVWALKSSRLPMRIRLWDPRDGDCIDVSFSYSIEQPEEFFDSERFARKLTKGKSKPRNLLYEDMIDPGGQPLNARELFETSGGYHMPVIEDIGITEEGIVWVTATKATNRMPNGYTFYGFDELQDDLGRTYTRVSGMQRLEGDISCTLFAALDDSGLALDPRTPTELTVICREPRHVSNPKVIGKRTFKEWKKNSHWPRDLISDEDWSLQKYFRGRKFSKLKQEKNWAALEELINEVPGNPEDSKEAFNRELSRMHILLLQGEYDQVIQLGEELLPISMDNYQRFRCGLEAFEYHLIALAAKGRTEDFKSLFAEIRDNTDRRVVHRMDPFLEKIIRRLSEDHRFTVDEISEITGVDIKKHKRFQGGHYWDWNLQYEKPVYAPWRKHLNDLAKHYESHPLPENMELLPVNDKDVDPRYAMIHVIPGIKSHRVNLYKRSVKSLVRGMAFQEPGRWRASDELENMKLCHDLIYVKDIDYREHTRFVLDYALKKFDLELVTVTEPRTVWIARYDGRPLKPYKEVKAPVPHEKGPYQTGMAVGWGSVSMAGLFQNFMYRRDENAQANDILIIDETGIKSIPDKEGDWASVAVSSENPTWAGEGGLDMAQKWFKEQFGVTFTEEVRPMPVHIVRQKTK